MVRPSSVLAQKRCLPSTILLGAAFIALELNGQAVSMLAGPDAAGQARLSRTYGNLPLGFEANQGQSDGSVKFLARGQGYNLFLTPTEAVLSLHASARHVARRAEPVEQGQPAAPVRMSLVGANKHSEVTGLDPLPGRSNYFIGGDPARWQRDVPSYARVKYAAVYPGIDLIYHGNQRQLEYDLVVAPGADPGRITLAFKGVQRLTLDPAGNLVLQTSRGEIAQHKPVIYQDIGGKRQPVDGRYVMLADERVGFRLARYDHTQPLVIDPVLSYSTYLGGTGNDIGYAIAVDGAGSAYVTGETNSTNFPGTGGGLVGSIDAFVTKLNAAGNALVYSVYLGGSGHDTGYAIAVDSLGNAYVTGETDSPTSGAPGSVPFPLVGPIQSSYRGGADAFITKINAAGNALVYSTYLGGSGNERGYGIAVDSSFNAYVTGHTSSIQGNVPGPNDFPTMAPFQAQNGGLGSADAFVTKINAAGSALVYSTYLGGNASEFSLDGGAIAVDSDGNAYVGGTTSSTNFPGASSSTIQPTYGGNGRSDAFVVKFNAAGSALLYSTYLGGTGDEAVNGIAIDADRNAIVVGYTTSTNFPTASPLQPSKSDAGSGEDAFVTKINAAGSALLYSTYLGGSGNGERALAVAVDGRGNAWVTGSTSSANFPTVVPFQALNAGSRDAFISKFNAAGTALLFSTYLGGSTGDESGYGIALDGAGNVYVAGTTSSTNFPTVNPFQPTYGGSGTDAFVSKISASSANGDYDGDGRTDFSVFRPSNGSWWIFQSATGTLAGRAWGAPTDIPVPGDYDGDGKADLAVFRPSDGSWWILRSSDGGFQGRSWGQSGDVPVPGDYDGDGKTDLAIFRPSDGSWWILRSSDGTLQSSTWGFSTDIPVPADYDGDGKADIAVFRPGNGTWFLQRSSGGFLATNWGTAGDVPVAGDYDGDGKADLAVFRPSSGSWWILRSSDGTLYGRGWGVSTDVPVPGDYDGDGKTDLAVFRPSSGTWWVLRSSDENLAGRSWGAPTDKPVVGSPR